MLPDGTPSPLTDQRVQALANAHDSQTIIDTIDAGVDPIANAAPQPDQVGYPQRDGYLLKRGSGEGAGLIADYKEGHPGR